MYYKKYFFVRAKREAVGLYLRPTPATTFVTCFPSSALAVGTVLIPTNKATSEYPTFALTLWALNGFLAITN